MQKTKEAERAETAQTRDWRETLFLPHTEFPMKAGLPKLEPDLLARWESIGLYKRLRRDAKKRDRFILHDGPPYANGHLHIGHALNKILKDAVTRSAQMMGHDSNYVPGWDCHGLPIEWKVEEQYRAKGKNKDQVPIIDFRRECREFAEHWVSVQREEFQRLGIEGDWSNPYLTMSYDAESIIAAELMKFAMNGTLYRGSKPVMWSVVERTALAEAEVEYEEHESPTVFVKFPVLGPDTANSGASVVIWTTTPWTIPGNRAIAYSADIDYGLYEVTSAPEENCCAVGERLIIADRLAESLKAAGRIEDWTRVCDVDPKGLACAHTLHAQGYDFQVRLYEGDFVTDEAGTGFVHIAPGHGADDYALFVANKKSFAEAGIEDVPHTVREDGYYFADVPLFGGDNPKRVITDKGKFGDANEAVIAALIEAGMLAARGKLRHQYPHSWRSKAPVIFRNTPQWFIALDRPAKVKGKKGKHTIRELCLQAIEQTRFVPAPAQRRLQAMVENRPDWVISRQRSWGVPITVFVHRETGEIIPNATFAGAKALIKRITDIFAAEGADAWFADGARDRFLEGLVDQPADWEPVNDILDVWFESGTTHAFVLERRKDLGWPAALYLEGSDQHRGWFLSSLTQSCATRGRAPYDGVLTHGFVMAEDGRKMSKSLGNVVAPQDVIKQSGAEILRIWALSTDYSEDLRIGPEVIKSSVDAYRKLRNSMRFLLGNLAHYRDDLRVGYEEMPELERYVLHRLHELDGLVRAAYRDFDFKRVFHTLSNFIATDLSALYFDIRKDTLYCEPHDSTARRACLSVLDELFSCLTAWLAPLLCFTMEEVWLSRFPSAQGSVHLRQFPTVPAQWRDEALAARWTAIRKVRRVVTGALEIERREKRIGSSLEAAPVIHIADAALFKAVSGADWAEVAITSAATLKQGNGPKDAYRFDEVPGVAVVPALAEGRKCARSWKISSHVGDDPDFPDLSPRDALAVRQFDARAHAGAGKASGKPRKRATA